MNDRYKFARVTDKMRTWTIKRVLIAIALLPVITYVIYIIVGGSAYFYLTHSYNKLSVGMTQSQVRSTLQGFTEKRVSIKELGTRELPAGVRVYRYDLLGFQVDDLGSIHVVYDSKDKCIAVYDTFD